MIILFVHAVRFCTTIKHRKHAREGFCFYCLVYRLIQPHYEVEEVTRLLHKLLNGPLNEGRRQFLEMIIWWGIPPLVVPALRWTQDPPEQRWNLFIRDFTTYSLGTGIFFLGKYLMEKATKSRFTNPQAAILLGSAFGLAINQLYVGIGAVKLSRWLAPTKVVPLSRKPSGSSVEIVPTVRPHQRPVQPNIRLGLRSQVSVFQQFTLH